MKGFIPLNSGYVHALCCYQFVLYRFEEVVACKFLSFSLPCEASMLGAFFCARHSYSLHHLPPRSSLSSSRLGTSSSSSCILIVILILVVIFIIGIIILIIILIIASTIVFSQIIIRVTYMPWKLHLRSRKM